MTLSHPWLIAAAVPAVLAFALAYYALERRRSAVQLRYSHLPFLVAAAGAPAWPARTLGAAWILAVALVVLAATGPHVRAAVPVKDGSVVLCIDTSGSMRTTDVQPSRAAAALSALRAFVDATPDGTAVGIVSFAGSAQAVIQPVRDRSQLRDALAQIPEPNGATAIGDALAMAQRMLPRRGHRLVVLITDGENNAGSDPRQAAQALGAARIPLYTVGIGTNSGALVPGTLEAAGIDEEALRAYASAAGGAYSRADDAAQLRAALARLGRSTLFTPSLVDLSLPAAIGGGILMALAVLAGIGAGRYP